MAGDREGALAEVVLRSPPSGRESRAIPVPRGTWRWETIDRGAQGPLETAPHARLVLRCQAPADATCTFGQPHLLRWQ